MWRCRIKARRALWRGSIESPSVWNLGPQRYPEIARRYQPLTKRADKLAIDINIVDRYQDVYPTKQQTGSELFELVHLASGGNYTLVLPRGQHLVTIHTE